MAVEPETAAFARGNEASRQQLLSHPELLLRASQPVQRADDPAEQLQRDLGALGGIARRALSRVQSGAVGELLPLEQDRLRRAVDGVRSNVDHLLNAIEQEVQHAR